ncbi:MAG: nucleoside phosphorylase [Bacteroidales bacterium]|jgi:uridine phosphorylase|nr:nucleoside phosphorylase [Bacteroidales bacterium]
MKKILESELILRDDGAVYHLNLKPDEIAENIILVGDPGRVDLVASMFDKVNISKQNREINSATGIYKGKNVSVISTGMGPDNLDIVVNELDALVNVDLKNRVEKDSHKALNLVRIGTSGGVHKDIPVGSFLFSSHGVGTDGLLNFYANTDQFRCKSIEEAMIKQVNWPKSWADPYIFESDKNLIDRLSKGHPQGMTMTFGGFYGPQGREVRLKLHYPEFIEKVAEFNFNNLRVANFEMETSALYGLSKMLGHNACTVCVIIANRADKTFIDDYRPAMKELIKLVLDRF